MTSGISPDTWYWDRRTRKALYPQEMGNGTVRFVTVWHEEEASDALEGGALVPLDDVGLDRTDTTFDLVDSFRTPDTVDDTASDHGETGAERDS